MIEITCIPAFKDNYLWLLEGNGECWVVDPGDATPVKKVLSKKGLGLTGILVTHHHADHVGGIGSLVSASTKVIGPALTPYPLVNDAVSEGDIRKVCGIDFRVMEVPGHTLNHVAYYAEPEQQTPVLFCGDTLFAGGCGRLFEGTPDQMHESLSRISKLPLTTQIYCAHEYTESNLEFASTVEPGNLRLQNRYKDVIAQRAADQPTIPSDLETELQTNPFLRVSEPEIIKTAASTEPKLENDPASSFGAIRRLKDRS